MSPPFAGFSAERARAIPAPPELFTEVLAEVQDIAELKVLLAVLRLAAAQKEPPRAVSFEALRADPYLARGLRGLGMEMAPAERLDRALERAVARGTLLHVVVRRGGHAESHYLLNTAANRQAVAAGELPGAPAEPAPAEGGAEEAAPAGIFRLYEQNIGLITPLLAEELAEAGRRYPAGWVEEAFREAVVHNRRSWRYVRAILERWEREGRGSPRRPGTETIDWERYKEGDYAHLFREDDAGEDGNDETAGS